MVALNFVFNSKLVPRASFFYCQRRQQAWQGLDSNPQPWQNPQQQNQTIFFNKGEEVEVSSDKEGFRGAWYLATILEFPKPQPQATVKSASKKKRKTIVQYKTLVTEDDFAPLVEQVGPHLIGPLPRNFYWKMVGFFMKTKPLMQVLEMAGGLVL